MGNQGLPSASFVDYNCVCEKDEDRGQMEKGADLVQFGVWQCFASEYTADSLMLSHVQFTFPSLFAL